MVARFDDAREAADRAPQWFWGDDTSMWAHLRGVREMIRLTGGLGPMNDPLLATVLVL